MISFWNQFLGDISWTKNVSWDDAVFTLKGNLRQFLNERAKLFDASNHKPGDAWKDGQFAEPHVSTRYGLYGETIIGLLLGQEPNLSIGADANGDFFTPIPQIPSIEVKTTWTNSLLVKCATVKRNIIYRLPLKAQTFIAVKLRTDDSRSDITQLNILGIASNQEVSSQPDSFPVVDNPNANWRNKQIHQSKLHSFSKWYSEIVDSLDPWWKNMEIIDPHNISDEIIHSLSRRQSQVPHPHP